MQLNNNFLSIGEIRKINKTDLHRHIDCSMKLSTMYKIAKDLDLIKSKTSAAEFKEQFLITEPMINLETVLNKFLNAQKLLYSEQVLEDLAYENCLDAFCEGINILELRYAPTFISEAHPHLTFEKIHQSFLKGIRRAESHFPIAVGLIGIIQRTKSLKIADSVTDFIIENKDSFIGIDLADSEIGFNSIEFKNCFQRAKKNGLHITVHSGEVPHPDAAKWVQQSIEILGAERIGHGVQVINDHSILKSLIDQNVTLEICPYSNYLTQAFETIHAHPVDQLYKMGVPLTINTDDPGIFNSQLTDEYLLLQQNNDWGLEHFQKIYQNGIKATFIKPTQLIEKGIIT